MDGWVGGWVDGMMDGWMDSNAGADAEGLESEGGVLEAQRDLLQEYTVDGRIYIYKVRYLLVDEATEHHQSSSTIIDMPYGHAV